MLKFLKGIFSVSNSLENNDVIDDLATFYNKEIDKEYDRIPSIKEAERSLLSLYKSYYHHIHTIAQQRLTVHSLFLTVHTIFSSMLGIFLYRATNLWINWSFVEKITILTAPYTLMLVLCVVWYKLLTEYAIMSYAFILLIKSMEKHLPIRPLTVLLSGVSHYKLNSDLSKLMKFLPITFIVVYLAMFIVVLVN